MGPCLAPRCTLWPDPWLLILYRKQDKTEKQCMSRRPLPHPGHPRPTSQQWAPTHRLIVDIGAGAHPTRTKNLHTSTVRDGKAHVSTSCGHRQGVAVSLVETMGCHWDLGPQGAGPCVACHRKKEIGSVPTAADAFCEFETPSRPTLARVAHFTEGETEAQTLTCES